MSEQDREMPEDARAALARGSKIEAIKSVRIAHGIGLREAKEYVERYLDENPEIARAVSAANVEIAKRGLGRLVLLAAAGTLLYWFFTR